MFTAKMEFAFAVRETLASFHERDHTVFTVRGTPYLFAVPTKRRVPLIVNVVSLLKQTYMYF